MKINTTLKKAYFDGEFVDFGDKKLSPSDSAIIHIEGSYELVIAANVPAILGKAFENCEWIYSVSQEDSTISLTIGDDAFSHCSNLVSASFSSVDDIGSLAFNDCSSLETVVLNGSVKELKYGTFNCCKKLRAIKLPDSLLRIGDLAFLDCTSLETIALPPALTSIGMRAFQRCSALELIQFPETLTLLDNHSFAKCSRLIGAKFPKSLTQISPYAFIDCTSLQAILFKGTIAVGESSFEGCTSLYAVGSSHLITSLGEGAFARCPELENIDLTGAMTVKAAAFTGCDALTSVEISDALSFSDYPALDKGFKGKITIYSRASTSSIDFQKLFDNYPGATVLYKGLTLVRDDDIDTLLIPVTIASAEPCPVITIPEGIVAIRSKVFAYSELHSVTFPSTLRYIGMRAFRQCSFLTKIDLSHVSKELEIEDEAFITCASLETAALPNCDLTLGRHIFKHCYALEILRLPELPGKSAEDIAEFLGLYSSDDIEFY